MATQQRMTRIAQAEQEEHVPLVMVIDDSVTVRKVTTR